ncbi:AMP-binding protein [Adlercreutzia caecimuris]|jgi:O-succinylbenzoate synthase|uniref:AMP-binding protein n=1 Tax=Adlercreutzia caecimuris TaxID=671266 RepID=UPI001372BC11|nr:AMP-binding protein [Adlercreutzia caecimuris]MCI9208788.1 AMP-binding protein [Adlercreutzia caecimuris]MCR2038071.1 AMP-binding protein [Adlercreutzia caecimuris]NBJ65650.1 o-succinylbenzoate synthase [Adlercreutzia caecimuris]
MIDIFESTAQARPESVFFSYVNRAGEEMSFTYRQTRLLAAQLARRLRDKGVFPGDMVAVDLPNCPLYVILALAAAYGGFGLVALNHRLTDAEKLTRLLELERCGVRIAHRVDADSEPRLFEQVCNSLLRGDARMGRVDDSLGGVMEDAIHFAERAAHTFDPDHRAIIMFTSGTTGKPKGAELTWTNLVEAAQASNRVLSPRSLSRGLWQAVLPFFHVGGFQVLVRSVCSRWSLRIYEGFDAAQVLRDAAELHATHISVVDKMLQDMVRHGGAALGAYQCILLGGGPLNANTVAQALAAKARVFASYGMTETSSQVANTLITSQFTGGLRLLPGYSARIVEPDAEGFGRLALRGPGVFGGYVNARAAFTVDGFFLTGDTAALHEGCLYIRERTADMFVSGGENVYPAEIVDALVRIPGVADAYVFGVPDVRWGRRPAAVVELAPGAPPLSAGIIKDALARRLSRLYIPEQICIVDDMPRTGIGKIDRTACEGLFRQHIDVKKVVLHRVRLPFSKPFKTPKETLTYRESVIVEVVDKKGRVGLGECTAFDTDWYLPETLGDDIQVMREVLAPRVIAGTYLHPREVAADLASIEGMERFPMAMSAIEMACWDLYGKVVEQPLWALLGEEFDRLTRVAAFCEEEPPAVGQAALPARRTRPRQVYSGAVVGMGTPARTVAEVRDCVRQGYRRIKLKVAPGKGLPAVRAVRRAFPELLITLDANQSFSLHHMAELRAYDSLDIGWIEEPLDLASAGVSRHEHGLARLASFQHTLAMPICVDESFLNAEEAERMFAYPELRCAMVKIGKFGGIQRSLEFVHHALSEGREVCMSGMYDTGISRFAHAAFQTLPGVVIPGDLGATARYFDADLTVPAYEAPQGIITLNAPGHEHGIGCDLEPQALAAHRQRRYSVE